MLKRMQKSRVDPETTRLYKYDVYRNNKHLHEKPMDALQCIQCPPLDGYSVPQMKCILRKCSVCPKYRTIKYEEVLTNLDPMIQFILTNQLPDAVFMVQFLPIPTLV